MAGRTILEVCAAVCAVAAAGGVVWKYLLRPVIVFSRRANAVLEDWVGVPADPDRGLPERPGVMRRISRIEQGQAVIRREVQYNGGSVTLADAVRNLKLAVNNLEEGRQANAQGIDQLGHKLDEQTTRHVAAAAEVRRDLQEHRVEYDRRIDELAGTLNAHATDSAEFLGQALSQLAEHGIAIEAPQPRPKDTP